MNLVVGAWVLGRGEGDTLVHGYLCPWLARVLCPWVQSGVVGGRGVDWGGGMVALGVYLYVHVCMNTF